MQDIKCLLKPMLKNIREQKLNIKCPVNICRATRSFSIGARSNSGSSSTPRQRRGVTLLRVQPLGGVL